MIPSSKFILLCMLLLLPVGFALSAQSNETSTDEQLELSEFLSLLEQQTDLATHSRLNADFVPGMVSVMSGEEMRRRGFKRLWDALAFIPGVQQSQDETGKKSLIVRGVGKLFESGKIKLLLNSIALNSSSSATTGTLYETPVEQIERIEFIRGPGSAIHGEFSLAGVLNVITRSRGNEHSIGIEAAEGYSFSSLIDINQPGDWFNGSLNIAAFDQQGEDIISGPDRSGSSSDSYAPGPINNKKDMFSAILAMSLADVSLSVQFQQANRGDYFGVNNLLPPPHKQTVISDSVVSLQLSQPLSTGAGFSVQWFVNMVGNETKKSSEFLGSAQAFGGFEGDDDIVADTVLKEYRTEAGINFSVRNGNHNIFAEMSAAAIDIEQSAQSINLDPATNLPSESMNPFPAPVDARQNRHSISLVLQDEYRVDDTKTLTAGFRYDDYENIGDSLSPRIALVWRASASHIFKTQFARAFRPPSLLELGGAVKSTIEAETIETAEIGHVYYSNNLVLRNTLYFSELENLITFQDSAPFGYDNTENRKIKGYEFEVINEITPLWTINSNISLQDSDENATSANLTGTVPWMIKLSIDYAYQPSGNVNFQINSVSNNARQLTDTRAKFPAMNQADISVAQSDFLGVNGLTFNAGIQNIFNEELKFQSPLDTYPGDYPYSNDAMWWLRLSYRP